MKIGCKYIGADPGDSSDSGYSFRILPFNYEIVFLSNINFYTDNTVLSHGDDPGSKATHSLYSLHNRK